MKPKTLDLAGTVRSLKSFFTGIPYTNPIDWNAMNSSSDGLFNNEYESKSDQLKANLGWVYAANTAIADNCSAVPFRLLHNMKDGDQEEVFSHEILDLLDNPNMFMSAKQLWNLYYQYLNLTGEAYILKLDQRGEPLTEKKLPSALFPLPSHLCSFNYEGKNSYDEITITYNGQEFPVQAILRDINPDPENPYVGISVVRKAALTIDTDTQMKKWNNKLFKNGARPGVVIEVPDQLKDDAYKRLKQQFDEQYKGADNAFNRIILEGGAKINPFMMSQQDLDFLESKRFTRDEILAMFKVSASNLGITEDVNRANAEAQKASFTERCVVPRLDQLVDMLNQRLIYPLYGREYELSYENPVPEDQEQKLNEATNGVNAWLTIDEVRDLYGYEPLPDGLGREIYAPINQAPLSELALLNGDDEEPTDAPEPSGDGSTPEDGGDSGEEPEQPVASLSEPNADDEQKKAQEKRNQIGNAKVKAYTLKSLRYEKMILKKARKMFNSQKKDVLKWLEDNFGKGKAVLERKDWAESMVDWEEYNTQFAGDLQAILQMIIDEVGTEAFLALVEGEFDAYTDAIQQYLRETAELNAMSINAETEKQIRATLAQGIRNNETVQQLQSRVSQVFGAASTNRAFTIAQTESALAENFADEQAWVQTGVVSAKEWFTAEDERVCGWCAEMDGKVIGLGDNFFNKGDRFAYTDANDHQHLMNLDYRNIDVPPLHPSCRCVLLPVL